MNSEERIGVIELLKKVGILTICQTGRILCSQRVRMIIESNLYLKQLFDSFLPQIPFYQYSRKLFHIMNEMYEIPKCPICGEEIAFLGFSAGYYTNKQTCRHKSKKRFSSNSENSSKLEHNY